MTTSVNEAEEGDIESLYFFQKIGNRSISVAMCPDNPQLTSIVGTDRNGNFFHLLLTREETDLVIEGLKDVKARQDLRVV